MTNIEWLTYNLNYQFDGDSFCVNKRKRGVK